jgi:hypothetical protein
MLNRHLFILPKINGDIMRYLACFLIFSFVLTGMALAQSPIVINEIMFDVPKDPKEDPSGDWIGDANGDGIRSFASDEFIELVNSGNTAVDISGWKILQRKLKTIFTFPDGVILQPGEFCVVFGGVGDQGFADHFPPTLKIFSAQPSGETDLGFEGGGRTNLSNKGDNVILRNAKGVDIAEVYWGKAKAKSPVGIKLSASNTIDGSSFSKEIRQSVTRNPDITGLWALHSTVGNKKLFSPGAPNTVVYDYYKTAGEQTGGLIKDEPKASSISTNLPVVAFNPKAGQGIQKGAAMRLEGIHTFTANPSSAKETVKWTLDRTTISEKGGKPVRTNSIVSVSGLAARFNLPKVPGKETVYHVKASDSGFSDTFSFHVFSPRKISSFIYKSKDNPDLRVYLVVPATLNASSRLIMIMHGMSRTAYSYLANWKRWAIENNYIAIAPLFDEKNWPGSKFYNLGNLFTGNGKLKPESQWSFSVVNDIAEKCRMEFSLANNSFDIWGHSAGAQFNHRFLLFKPKSNVRFCFAANAGWYTAPNLKIAFPYGLAHPKFSFTRQDLFEFLRGTMDTERTSNLRQSPEADTQGRNRYKRAKYFYQQGLMIKNPQFNWKLIDVQGGGHSSADVATPAKAFLERLKK